MTLIAALGIATAATAALMILLWTRTGPAAEPASDFLDEVQRLAAEPLESHGLTVRDWKIVALEGAKPTTETGDPTR